MTSRREADIVSAFITFSDRLVDDFDLLDLTIELTEDCARLLDVAAAGLLLGDAAGRLHLLAATSERARNVEIFQLQRQEGPCLDCYQSGRQVSVADLRDETSRWPRFVAAATEQGFLSVHAVPMRLRNEVLGAVGLFGAATGSLSEADEALARALAHVASIAIAQRHHHANRPVLFADLQAAVASRATLEMAKGVVSAAQSVDMQVAFARLRNYAHHTDRALSDLSRELITLGADDRNRLLGEIGRDAGDR